MSKIKKQVAKRQDALSILDICLDLYWMPTWSMPTEVSKLQERVGAILYPDGPPKERGEATTLFKS